jgi:hypothetical protein
MASTPEPITDVEKDSAPNTSRTEVPSDKPLESDLEYDPAVDVQELPHSSNVVLQLTKRIERFLGLEARGIHRVKKNEQTPKTTLRWIHIVVLWFSINTASQNIILASIGQGVYGLGFLDATLCSVFGGILGSIPVAYTATWGPWSGNRTMVFSLESKKAADLDADSLLDLCSVLNGLVACQDLRSTQPSSSYWIFHD